MHCRFRFCKVFGLFVLLTFFSVIILSFGMAKERTLAETKKVKVFFPNSKFTPKMLDCSKVFPVERTVLAVPPGVAALEALLKGPTEEEKENGYLTSINSGVEVIGFRVKEGIARVNLSARIEENVGGSCWVRSIRAQIKETLQQFTRIEEVVIAVEGEEEAILQP